VTLTGSGHRHSFIFDAAHHLRKGRFPVQNLGSITVAWLETGVQPSAEGFRSKPRSLPSGGDRNLDHV
jgi:hypothetical protein